VPAGAFGLRAQVLDAFSLCLTRRYQGFDWRAKQRERPGLSIDFKNDAIIVYGSDSRCAYGVAHPHPLVIDHRQTIVAAYEH
jgi:hypothetical protein